jgi:hypothetical protein
MLHLGCDLLSHMPCPIDEMLPMPGIRLRATKAQSWDFTGRIFAIEMVDIRKVERSRL